MYTLSRGPSPLPDRAALIPVLARGTAFLSLATLAIVIVSMLIQRKTVFLAMRDVWYVAYVLVGMLIASIGILFDNTTSPTTCRTQAFFLQFGWIVPPLWIAAQLHGILRRLQRIRRAVEDVAPGTVNSLTSSPRPQRGGAPGLAADAAATDLEEYNLVHEFAEFNRAPRVLAYHAFVWGVGIATALGIALSPSLWGPATDYATLWCWVDEQFPVAQLMFLHVPTILILFFGMATFVGLGKWASPEVRRKMTLRSRITPTILGIMLLISAVWIIARIVRVLAPGSSVFATFRDIEILVMSAQGFLVGMAVVIALPRVKRSHGRRQGLRVQRSDVPLRRGSSAFFSMEPASPIPGGAHTPLLADTAAPLLVRFEIGSGSTAERSFVEEPAPSHDDGGDDDGDETESDSEDSNSIPGLVEEGTSTPASPEPSGALAAPNADPYDITQFSFGKKVVAASYFVFLVLNRGLIAYLEEEGEREGTKLVFPSFSLNLFRVGIGTIMLLATFAYFRFNVIPKIPGFAAWVQRGERLDETSSPSGKPRTEDGELDWKYWVTQTRIWFDGRFLFWNVVVSLMNNHLPITLLAIGGTLLDKEATKVYPVMFAFVPAITLMLRTVIDRKPIPNKGNTITSIVLSIVGSGFILVPDLENAILSSSPSSSSSSSGSGGTETVTVAMGVGLLCALLFSGGNMFNAAFLNNEKDSRADPKLYPKNIQLVKSLYVSAIGVVFYILCAGVGEAVDADEWGFRTPHADEDPGKHWGLVVAMGVIFYFQASASYALLDMIGPLLFGLVWNVTPFMTIVLELADPAARAGIGGDQWLLKAAGVVIVLAGLGYATKKSK